MLYQGPERRLHRVLITEHTEYHMRGDLCVAVRDHQSGQWQAKHKALGTRLEGSLATLPNGSLKISFDGAELGEQLCFRNDVLTTPLREITRPPRDVVAAYPTH